jgi:organic radical activating enzyme
MKKLRVNDIFYTIQGEGAHAGEAAIFIRLAGCNLSCSFCDTAYETFREMDVSDILPAFPPNTCKTIVWTGGEPALQLTYEIIKYFKSRGYFQAIETNGSVVVPYGLDYVSCSPKVPIPILLLSLQHYESIGEFRYLVGLDEMDDSIVPPRIDLLPKAEHYYVSPLFVGNAHEKLDLDKMNLQLAIDWVKANPDWKLTIQQHKIWNIR